MTKKRTYSKRGVPGAASAAVMTAIALVAFIVWQFVGWLG